MNKEQAINKLEDCIDFINQIRIECSNLQEHIKSVEDYLKQISSTCSLVEYHINNHMEDKENETI